MRAFAAAAQYELAVVRRSPTELPWLFVAPLYTVIVMTITTAGGRPDLATYAVLGPGVMALIGTAVMTAGDLVDRDRSDGILELLVQAPVSFSSVLFGRVVGVVSVGLIGLVESWVVAGLLYDHWVIVRDLPVFVGTLALTTVATAGASLAMAALFVLVRSARTLQNALTFPLFLLGGVLVPLEMLPGWVQPLGRLVYLSWATDLLRDATELDTVPGVWLRWTILIVLGAAATLVGNALVRTVVRRVRQTGAVSHT